MGTSEGDSRRSSGPRRRRGLRRGRQPDGAPDSEPSSEESRPAVVDPTQVLLGRISGVESRVPWAPLGIALLVALWLPLLPRLAAEDVRPVERTWVAQVVQRPGAPAGASAFARTLSRSAWDRLGVDVRDSTLQRPEERWALRAPAAAASLAGLVVFFFLARLVVGWAGALLAVSLLAVCEPWSQSGASATPRILGEMLVLVGVIWVLKLQARHREVGVAPSTAVNVGFAGLFLGLAVVLTPAAFATAAATLAVWFSVALRRSRTEATTLPVASPRHAAAIAVAGTVLLAATSVAALWGAERLAGGAGIPELLANGDALARGADLWTRLYRGMLSPGPVTDWLLAVTLALVLLVRGAEWRSGRQWQTAGLGPWVFLGLWAWALQRDPAAFARLDVPVSVPPLFVLGLAWLFLRGLQAGRFRRQEYTFVLVWLGAGVLFVPFVPGSAPDDSWIAAAVTLLPPVLILAGRAVRALWESKATPVARAGVLAFAFLPVAVALAASTAGLAGDAPRGAVEDASAAWGWAVLLGGVTLGFGSEIATVRPDRAEARNRVSRRRPGPRRGRPRRSGARRGGDRPRADSRRRTTRR